MKYIIYYLTRAMLAVIPLVVCWYWVPRIGPWATMGALALGAAMAVAAGGWLLKTSTVSKITWKNRTAGVLAPWGWRFSNGTLGRGLLASWVIWMLLAIPGLLLAVGPSHLFLMASGSPASASPSTSVLIFTWMLVGAWVLDGAALLYVVGVHMKNFSPGSRASLSLLKVIGVVALILISSVALYLGGQLRMALIVAGGPPVFVGTIMGLYILVILTAGKNVRWN